MTEPMKWSLAVGAFLTLPIWGLPYVVWMAISALKEALDGDSE